TTGTTAPTLSTAGSAGYYPQPFNTATVPFWSVSSATQNPQQGATAVPAFSGLTNSQTTPTSTAAIQPHTFPYLVDKFFYTGASNFYYPPTAGGTDPGNVVGGPGGDGWFKMFEFVEVPSQMAGAVGPVAQGANFDWARQDSKPGLMN